MKPQKILELLIRTAKHFVALAESEIIAQKKKEQEKISNSK
jgi:hypothetical protein